MLPDKFTNEVYGFICTYDDEHGLPPTYATIAHHLGITISVVRRCLDVLEAKGKIYREYNTKPAIRIVARTGERAS